ncbi:hypothetical protein ABGB17_34425 [Sphaerisporangium sp. B11E5]|uniref:hypothetical protein n=1 Tax=Sphaerisporangium sp. B11E5 TaxID=3153563 RepID=UPI00325E008A
MDTPFAGNQLDEHEAAAALGERAAIGAGYRAAAGVRHVDVNEGVAVGHGHGRLSAVAGGGMHYGVGDQFGHQEGHLVHGRVVGAEFFPYELPG